MKTKQWHIQKVEQINWTEVLEFAPHLVLLFGAPSLINNPVLQTALDQYKTKTRFVGCSTAGEIAAGEVHQNSLAITAIRFANPDFKTVAVTVDTMHDSFFAGLRLAETLEHSKLDSVMVFAPGLNINGSALIAGMSSALPTNTPITGGLAGDDAAFKQTWTIHGSHVSDRQIVAIGFYNKRVKLNHGSAGGWQPFGPARKVTRCDGNILYELDGQPALQIYKKYLGDYASQLPSSGLLFPFEMLGANHNETGLIRTILGIDELKGSLILAGDIEQDGYLRLMHANTDALIDGAQSAAETARAPTAGGNEKLAILVSCVGRRLVMGDAVDEEVEAVAGVFGSNCTLSGFYSYGEISPFCGALQSKLHNQTMTITVLNELET